MYKWSWTSIGFMCMGNTIFDQWCVHELDGYPFLGGHLYAVLFFMITGVSFAEVLTAHERSARYHNPLPCYERLKVLSVFFLQNFGVIQRNGQTKAVDATIQLHSSQNCLISQWWPSKNDLSAIKYFCRPVANTCTNVSISPLPLHWLATSRDICHAR